ncbi:MAG: class I SAM-dependent methyltransferase [Gammaproteobacteria bacterium]|jgi:tellurite methyltransferase
MAFGDREKWDRIHRDAAADEPCAARVLAEFRHLLPRRGTALDLACGRGGNALLLARAGLETHAWDISAEALQRLSEHASRMGLVIHARQRDAAVEPPEADSFDVIVISRFLERTIAPALAAALKARGLLYYQTFTKDKDPAVGPGNPAYLLERGELLSLFAELRPVVYREEGRIGDLDKGFRNETMLIARKE